MCGLGPCITAQMLVDGSLHIQRVTKTHGDKTYSHAYLRQSYREGDKVKKRTLGNLSALPSDIIDAIDRMLKGHQSPSAGADLELTKALPHGHVAAVLKAIQALSLDTLLYSRKEPWRQRVLAMIIARLVRPGSKASILRWAELTTMPQLLGLESDEPGKEREYYEAMDRLLKTQPRIELELARRHLEDQKPALYDVSSSYFEGRKCPLAYLGYSRDGKSGKLQIVYGLLTSPEGCPIAIEVFNGNTGDSSTLHKVAEKLSERFAIDRAILVGDRGMIAESKLDVLREAELDWITSMKSGQIRDMARRELFQPDLFADKQITEILDPERPGERFMVCMNTSLREERRRKREDLLVAAEKKLKALEVRVNAGKKLKQEKDIGLAVGKALARSPVRKHFDLVIGPGSFSWSRKQSEITEEAKFDGVYVVRTSVKETLMGSAEVVAAYKSLKWVERAFRSMKSMQLEVRPIHHRLEERVRAHLFLAMLAYYVEWHLRRAWKEHLAKGGENGKTLKDLLDILATLMQGKLETAGNFSLTLEGTPSTLQKELLDLAAGIELPKPKPVDKT